MYTIRLRVGDGVVASETLSRGGAVAKNLGLCSRLPHAINQIGQ
jgi:hypothetical protein